VELHAKTARIEIGLSAIGDRRGKMKLPAMKMLKGIVEDSSQGASIHRTKEADIGSLLVARLKDLDAARGRLGCLDFEAWPVRSEAE
jgi:hypothetical protein